jgi:hypothetical protein
MADNTITGKRKVVSPCKKTKQFTLETKPTNKSRPQSPRPEPINNSENPMINKFKERNIMTDNSNNRSPLISSLETKQSDQSRPSTPQPTPINGCSEKSHD